MRSSRIYHGLSAELVAQLIERIEQDRAADRAADQLCGPAVRTSCADQLCAELSRIYPLTASRVCRVALCFLVAGELV